MRPVPRITIVTPSFNQGQYLERTIRSVLDQGYPDLEYIVMDGGSTDGSVELLRRYAGRLAHWESGPDGGQAAAIDAGFRRATGDVIGYVNSDDLLLRGSLMRVGRHFAARPAAAFGVGDSLQIDGAGRVLCRFYASPPTFRSIRYYTTAFNQPAAFWRRQAYEAVGGIDRAMRFCFDRDLFIRLSLLGPAQRLPGCLAAFRWHDRSKTSTIQDVARAESDLLDRRYGLTAGGPMVRGLGYFWYRMMRSPRWFLRQVSRMHAGLRPVHL